MDKQQQFWQAPSGARLGSLQAPASGLAVPESAERLLSRLPQSIVRDGKVVPVRNKVAKLLAPNAVQRNVIDLASQPVRHSREWPHQPAICNQAADSGLPAAGGARTIATGQGSAASVATQPAQQHNDSPVVTLQVKAFGGKQIHVLRMAASNTIDDVYAAVRQHCAPLGQRFELRRAYPPAVLHEDAASLESLGLAPNATILMHAISQADTADS